MMNDNRCKEYTGYHDCHLESNHVGEHRCFCGTYWEEETYA